VSIGNRTVGDFGEQWEHFGDFDGFYGSVELLQDTFGPLLSVEELRGLRTADIGAGTGRSTLMMIQAGAKSVVAVEPSDGVDQLRDNTKHLEDQVEVIHGPGEALPADSNLDFIFSYGVIQFIPDPMPVLQALHRALRPGGRLVIWVYGREGNELYLMLLKLLRSVSTRLPHAALAALCSTLNVLLTGYIALCRVIPLPLHRYMRNTLGSYASEHRKIVIYDQLNPTHVVYHTRAAAKALLEDSGFTDVQLYHRHGYSWTVMGTREPAGNKP
jgi:SAM-dependent methyltransferase